MTWQQRVEPLMQRFRELNARMHWEGYVSLDLDHPRKRDIILQHWCVADENRVSYYIVQIWADGSGWDCFGQLDNTNSVEKTLEAIN